jgi:AraC-like DNA-binding protein/quercetin dioxygenase-like cupin family protein
MKAEYRNVLSQTTQSLLVFVFEDKEFPAAWHFHPQFELTYIKSSSGMRYIGDSIYNFSPGDLVLVGTNLPHCWKTVGEQKTPVKAVISQFSEELLGYNWLEKTEFQNIRKMLQLSSRGIKFSENTAADLEDILLELPYLPPFEKLMSLLNILNSLSKEKAYSLLASTDFIPNITKEDSNRISIIQAYVKNNVQSRITIKEVAALLSLTEVSFCRYFKKIHNKPFITFLNEFRIALACKLLIETDLTVNEIGYECGFNSISLFHRLFKRCMKQTPVEYRNSYHSITVTIAEQA